MPNPITIKIDRKLVDCARVFVGKPRADGSIPEYYDFVLIPRKEVGRFGDTHMVVQACTKPERDAGLKMPIIGDGKEKLPANAPQSAPQKPAATHPPTDNLDEDVPF